jgi:hypothetical protein
MNDRNMLVDRYFEMWNESDPVRRRDLIVATFTQDASFLGPLLQGEGRDGIEALTNRVHENLAGHRFVRTGDIDAHHDRVRFNWEILPPDGQPRFAAGVDFWIVSGDGRLRLGTAFLDQAPDLEGVAHHEAHAIA